MSGSLSGSPAGERILVVEDDPGVAHGLRALLASRGYRVDVAREFGSALRRIGERSYRLVVADFNLGSQDGVELLRRIRRRLPRTPVVAVTAVDRDAATAAVEDLGLAGCFEKPVDPDRLLQAVARCLHP